MQGNRDRKDPDALLTAIVTMANREKYDRVNAGTLQTRIRKDFPRRIEARCFPASGLRELLCNRI